MSSWCSMCTNLPNGREDVKLIGVYSSKSRAAEGVARLRLAHGFHEIPEGFSVNRYPWNQENWFEGFVGATSEGAKAKGGEEGLMRVCAATVLAVGIGLASYGRGTSERWLMISGAVATLIGASL